MVTVFRWIAVLPGALIGAGLLQFLLVVLYMLVARTGGPSSLTGHLLFRTIVNVVFGATTVGLASSIAPSHRGATAMGAAALFGLLSAAIWASGVDVGAEWDRYSTLVSAVAALITALAAQRARAEATPVAHTAGSASSA